MNEQIVRKMTDYNNNIKETRTKIEELLRREEKLEKEIKEREFALMEEITNEVGNDGKPTFKNADSRKAEMNKRLLLEKNHDDNLKKLYLYKEEIKTLQIELEWFRNLFSINKLIGYSLIDENR